MILRVAVATFTSRPLRGALLAGGFGFGIAVMAALLGVGDVILEQARSPALNGGGEAIVFGAAGEVEDAEFLIHALRRGDRFAGRVETVSPRRTRPLYLVGRGEPLRVGATGGVPSLERAVGDPETASVAVWTDAPRDESWVSPEPAEVLHALDRFHAIPDAPRWRGSWAEWLYFNGVAGETRFYLSFIFGESEAPGRRVGAARLQLVDALGTRNFSETDEVDAATLLREAPNVAIGLSSVRLDGMTYEIDLDLPREGGSSDERVRGTIRVRAPELPPMPPLVLRGAAGWESGYVVPVPKGTLSGRLDVNGTEVSLDGGRGYHDHNWGFWEEVRWRWGEAAGDDVSVVYGRVLPPADALDPESLPSIVIVRLPNGDSRFLPTATIEEEPGEEGIPRTIRVAASGIDSALDMEFDVEHAVRSPVGDPSRPQQESEFDFVQMRGTWRVSGRLGQLDVDYSTIGSAETFLPTP